MSSWPPNPNLAAQIAPHDKFYVPGVVCDTCSSEEDFVPWFEDALLESGGDDPSTWDCELARLLPEARRLLSDEGVANHLWIEDDVVPVQSELLCASYSRHSTGFVSTKTGLLSPLARSCAPQHTCTGKMARGTSVSIRSVGGDVARQTDKI